MDEHAGRVRVWDWTVRAFHWLVVALLGVLWWTGETGRMDWHVGAGIVMTGLIAFRIYWGFAGPETARFSRFVKGPRTVAGYAGRLFRAPYRPAFGHNPLGGLSVIALLLVLLVQVGTGLVSEDVDGLSSGPLSRFVDYETGLAATDWHEASFNVLLALSALHIAAIILYRLVLRTNLVGAMVTGTREVDDPSDTEDVCTPPLRALVGIALAAALVVLLFRL
jgi:cytochrome b